MIFKIGNRRYSLKSIAIVTFLIYPIFSVPLFVVGILKKEKWAFILCALFMGLLSILYPPAGDLYRYAEDFNLYKDSDWDTFILLLVLKFDYVLPFLSYCIGKLGGAPELTRFIFAFLSYYLLFDLFFLIIKRNSVLCEKRLYLYALIILVPFTFWTFLFRYFFAASFLLNGLYRWNFLGDKKGLLLVFLSAFIHISYLPFIVICLVSRYRLFKFHYMFVCLLYVLSFVCDTTLIGTQILSILPFSDSLVVHIYEYIDGSQSESITNQYSLQQMIILYVTNIISFYIFYVYIKSYKSNYNKGMNFVNCMLLLLLVTASFPTMFGRFIILTSLLINICILDSYNATIYPAIRKHIKYICYATVFLFIISCWQRRFFLSCGFESKIFTSSFYDIISFSYSDDWIERNIDREGNFYKWIESR